MRRFPSLTKSCLGLLSVVVCCAAGTCAVPSIGVECSGMLDASEFGFTATAPADFECATVVPNSELVLSVRYRNASGVILSIVVGPDRSAEAQAGDGVTITPLDDLTTANGLTFERTRVVIATGGINITSYVATYTLGPDRVLGITVAHETDSAALEDTLDAVLESVQLVNG